MSRINRPDIFAHHGHLTFLKEWLAWKQASHPSYSLRALARSAKISPSLLSMVIKEKRKLTPKALFALANAMKLSPQEAAHFEKLARFTRTDNLRDQHGAIESLKKSRNFRRTMKREYEVSQYLSRWYNVVIREMAALPDFKADPAWVRERLRLDLETKKIDESLRFLLENGFLESRPDGGATLPEKQLNCEGRFFKAAIAQFHREMFHIAGGSIEFAKTEERNILGHTLVISQDNFQDAKKELDAALDKIRALGELPGTNTEVYHLQMAFFPITRRSKS